MSEIISFKEFQERMISAKNKDPDFNQETLETMTDLQKKLNWHSVSLNEYFYLAYAYYLYCNRQGYV